MGKRRFVLLVAGAAAIAVYAQAQEVRIDFGSSLYKTASSAGKNWNNITNSYFGSTRLVNYTTGANTPWTASVSNAFELTFVNGTTAPTGNAASLFGSSATRDSFVTLGQVDKGEITFSGLDKNKQYDFKIFGSASATRNLSTSYSLKGTNTVSGILNAANNASNLLSLQSVRPSSGGIIRLTVDTAGANNSLLQQAILNGLTMTEVSTLPPPPPPEVAKNLLFFGNSFTQVNTMTATFAEIAVADAHPRPYVVAETGDSRSLGDALTQISTNPAANINNIPAGQKWDNVIMQEFSTGATSKFGDPSQFRADAVSIYNTVKTNNPAVKPVLYETWAYLGTDPNIYGTESYQYANPSEMQADIHGNYNAAAGDLESLTGNGNTLVAHVGDQWEKLSFAADLYGGYDTKHPGPRGSLIAALTLYKTIYDEDVTDIPWASVQSYFSTRQITEADWTQLTALVESAPAALNAAQLGELLNLVPEPTSIMGLAMCSALVRRRR